MECNVTTPGKGTSLSSVRGTPPAMAHFTAEVRCMSLKDGRRLFRRWGLKKFPGICSAWMDTLMTCPIRKGGSGMTSPTITHLKLTLSLLTEMWSIWKCVRPAGQVHFPRSGGFLIIPHLLSSSMSSRRVRQAPLLKSPTVVYSEPTPSFCEAHYPRDIMKQNLLRYPPPPPTFWIRSENTFQLWGSKFRVMFL